MTFYDTRHNTRRSIVIADDGQPLDATWYLPDERPRGAVLVAAAMGTPASFYGHFATWLAGSGFATLTFDYRGTRDTDTMRAEVCDLRRWYDDAASALEALLEEVPAVPVTWVGHSLGGQALPFVRHDLLDRALLVAAGSGYWRLNQPAIRRRAQFFFRVVVPLAIRATGYYPGRRLGLLGDVPPNVMRQWGRWCLHRDYYGVDVPDLGGRVAELALPITALSFTDDELLSDASHQALEELYDAAPLERHRLSPEELGLPHIGHHGFFRRGMEQVWEQVALPHLAVR